MEGRLGSRTRAHAPTGASSTFPPTPYPTRPCTRPYTPMYKRLLPPLPSADLRECGSHRRHPGVPRRPLHDPVGILFLAGEPTAHTHAQTSGRSPSTQHTQPSQPCCPHPSLTLPHTQAPPSPPPRYWRWTFSPASASWTWPPPPVARRRTSPPAWPTKARSWPTTGTSSAYRRSHQTWRGRCEKARGIQGGKRITCKGGEEDTGGGHLPGAHLPLTSPDFTNTPPKLNHQALLPPPPNLRTCRGSLSVG